MAVSQSFVGNLPGRAEFAPKAPTFVTANVLGVATAETVTPPTGAKWVIFSSTADFYCRWDGSVAAIPATEVTDGTSPELNPEARFIGDVTTFSLISPAAAIITMAWYLS